ncbi:MAG: deoxyribose-phosphate aldolase [Candidatus Nealsonbacteria bacterium]|nr:deoxyribose-phosphate aldolase [Candidatus Nealsonbacteria bacterium]
MKKEQVAKLIDHTDINKSATEEDIRKLCQEAKEYGFRGVCVRPEWVKLCKKEVEGTDIKVVVLIDAPMGLSSHQKRVEVCRQAKEDGADNLDIVMNIVDLKYERYSDIVKDLKEICKMLPTKVIIGSGYLTDEEVRKASELVKEANCSCVKTATEKDPLERRELPEKFRHLKIMRQAAPGLEIKVAGKIRTLEDVQGAVKAGADIVGTSTGVEIMEQAE